MITRLKQYFAYTYYRLKSLSTSRAILNLSSHNMDEFRENNIAGYRTNAGLKKLTISYINTKAGQGKFVLNHLYKKQVIYDDGINVLKLPLEPAHLLNLKFKKDEQLNAYIKAGMKIFYTSEENSTYSFFVTTGDATYKLPYIHSLQNYCRLIKNNELDFSMLL